MAKRIPGAGAGNAAPNPAPRANDLCPLCGRPNGCVPARCGNFGEACWCESVAVSADVLKRIAPALRGVACLCAACAAKA